MRNKYKIGVIIVLLGVTVVHAQTNGKQDRTFWIQSMLKIVHPVLNNLSHHTLKQNMPFESLSSDSLRVQVSYLEAVGRTLCGIAPWLELGGDDTKEGKLRTKYITMTVKALQNAVNPNSPDYLVFDNRHKQPLVDAAFLAQALIRAPKQLWGNLDDKTQQRLITELKRSRSIKPYNSNWLLFASMVETALLEFTGEYNADRLYHGINKFSYNWYDGDGWYGDGAVFRMDYYNGIVIHPLLTDILLVLEKHNLYEKKQVKAQLKRLTRYAETQERFISPEGTYPVIGRSIVYRFGVFHALSQAALKNALPKKIKPAQVRSALTKVLKRQLASPYNFDKEGWLKIGFNGSQINMSESYINTGSLYMCAAVFLPLGLPENNPFWNQPYTKWSSLKAWNGVDIGRDKSLRDK